MPAAVSAGVARGRDIHHRDRNARGLLTLILLAILAWALLQVEWQDGLARTGGLGVLWRIVTGLAQPDISPDTLGRAFSAAWLTVVYAVAGMTLALGLGIPLGIIASGTLSQSRGRRVLGSTSGRGLLAAMRAVHELVWAWLFVVAIGLSPFAAVFAIGIPYAGILGRIYADLLNDVPEAPLRALRATGAGEFRVLLYGRMPSALPDLVAYSFYRFECALRASAIMGFVGLGGLGFEIQIALSDLDYQQVSTYLATLVILITSVEGWSSIVRRQMVA